MMKEKIKVLFISTKRQKKKITKGATSIEDYIVRKAPDMYEFIYGFGEEEAIKQVEKYQPKIILIPHIESMDSLGLLRQIKQLHPFTVIFIMILEIVDDEQETIDEYMASGAYKCFLTPLMIDTLIHDMYVALNLE